MAIVSDIEIRLRADIARLQQDMDRARQTVSSGLDKIKSMAKAAGAAIVAAVAAVGVGMFAGFIKEAIDAADAASDIAQKTGLAVEEIAGLQMWFEKGGMEAGALEGAMAKLAKTMATSGEDFARIGVQTKDANGEFRTTAQVLADTADVFASMPDDVKKMTLAIELFGKSGTDMIPMLNEGHEGLEKMREAADRLGLTFDQKVVDQAGEFNDTMDMLGMAAKGTGRQMAAALLPALQAVAGSFLEFVNKTDGARKAAVALGLALKVLYTMGVGLFTSFTAWAKIISGFATSVGSNMSTLFTALRQGIEGDYAKAWQTLQAGAKSGASILNNTFTGVRDDLTAAAKTISDTWTGAGGDAVDTIVKVTAKGNVASASAVKAAKAAAAAVKEQADRYRELLAAADERVAASAREAEGLKPLNEAQRLTADLDKQIALGKVKLTELQDATLRSRYAEIEANLGAVESQKAYAKMQEDAGKMDAELAETRASAIKAAEDEAKSNEALAATFGMSAAAIANVELARLQEQLAQRSSVGMTLDEIEHLEQLIVLKERSAQALTARESMESVKEFWSSVDKTAHDTFVSILDGGKGLGKRLKDTLKNTFFDWLYQMTIKKWIINIGTSTSNGGAMGAVADMFAGSGSGGGIGGNGGGGFGIGNLLSIGKTIYSGFTSGFASSIGGYISQLGSAFGSTAATSFGAGMSSPGTAAIISELGSGAAGATSATSGAAAAGSASAGASAGAYAIPIAGWIAAGMALSKGLYAQGWQADNGSMNTLGNVVSSGSKILDSALRGIGLSKSTANMFSGMSTYVKLFGRKNPEITSQGIKGTFGTEGFTGQAFANIMEKGGWFRSTKRYQKTASLGAEQENAFDSTMMGMAAAAKNFGAVMGVQSDVLNGYSKQISLTLDKDEAKNKEMIDAVFADIGNELAARVVPNIAALQHAGETAAQALQRLAGEFQVVDAVLETLGTTSTQAFRATGIASLEARTRLVELAGGIDALASQTQFFAENFLSKAQQIAPAQELVTSKLAELGYAYVENADQYRDAVLGLVKSGALATDAGARTYSELMKLGPAFKQVADYAAEVRAEAIEAGRAQADLLMAEIERQVAAKRDAITSAYEAAMDQLESRIDGVNDTIARTGELSAALHSALGTVDSDAQAAGMRTAAKAQIAAALAIAKASGQLPKAEDLRDALAALGRDASGQFDSLAAYQREVARTNNELIQLGAMSDEQLGTAERQLRALQDAQAAAKVANEMEMARLDGILTTAQTQVAALASANVTLTQIAETLAALRGENGAPLASLVDPRMPRVSMAPPTLNYVAPSATTMNSESAMLIALQRMEMRMANVEQNTLRTASASTQFARQFDTVSAGGNALATEVL